MSGHHLAAQKRMAMQLMKVGQRGVWLDPEKKAELAAAKTRAAVRDLIEKGLIRRREPRQRQAFVMPPQYMSRYRQRLLCDPKVRYKQRFRKKAPSSGKRYFDPKYWVRRPGLDGMTPEEIEAAKAAALAADPKIADLIRREEEHRKQAEEKQ